MSGPRVLAVSAATATAAVLVAAVVLAAQAPTTTSLVNLGVGISVGSLCAVLGTWVARREPHNVVGALLTFVGLAVALSATREVVWQLIASTPPVPQSVAPWGAALEEGAWWILVGIALLLLYFPDGRLPSARWRFVPPALVVATAVNQVEGAFVPLFRAPLDQLEAPFEGPGWIEVLGLSFFVMLGLVVACAVSLVLRYRHSGLVQRRKIRWLALAGLGVTAYPLLCLVEIVVWGEPGWFSVAVGFVGLLGVPVATAIAVLRDDLYDVDTAIAGVATWGLVTGALVLLYAVVAVVAGVWLGNESSLAAALATALCALALSPVRHRLHRIVDRRLYPQRRAAFEALDLLQLEVSAGRAQPEQLESVLRTALRDPTVQVGYRAPDATYVDVAGARVDPGSGVPVTLADVQVGLLSNDDASVTRELLRQVAERATALVEMVRLRLELARALHEVEASRTRLVQIGFEERRRLEQDLHDGAQQRLVSLGMAIRLAQRHLDDGTVDVDALMDQSVAELATAVAELRQIAHGIRPSTLDDGLPAALSRLVRGLPLHVDMEVDVEGLPDDIATTAYFVISEALANAVKHAEAQRIGLHVSRLDGHVVVRVSDDGCGGAALSPESGMADRVAALGGSLSVASPHGAGTVVEVEIPCAS